MLLIRPKPDQPGDQSVEQKCVPLKKVSVESTIRSYAADVTIKQVYTNEESTPIEAVYCFPIEEQAAVYSFVARIDDREIVAQLKEKKEAQQEYTGALQQGHGAYLLEQDEKSQDNFIINIGALPPGKECTIIISYVTELELVEQGSKIRFVVPTTIAPRYSPEKRGLASPADTTSKYVQKAPYTIEFHCSVEKLGQQVAQVSSPSHPIQIDLAQESAFVITLAQQNTHLDKDFILEIKLADKRSNTVLAVEQSAIMAAFSPSEEDCHKASNQEQGTTNEFIFVVDCSGSMEEENKIGLARQAMLLFLKSLPEGCYFNIVRFGSSYKLLFQEATAVYDEANVQKAEQLLKTLDASLGGTELLEPLKWLEKHPPVSGRARQIFLLTDGEISNVTQVTDLCRSMAGTARIFSFGLGASPSRSLVKGLARATNGRFVFIPPNSKVDVHVGQQLEKALQPCITNINVKWNLGVAASTQVQSAPTKTPPVYANDRLIVYGLLDEGAAIDATSSVQLETEKQLIIGEAKINGTTPNPASSQKGMIARLAAKALILELQHSKLPPKKLPGSMQARFQEIQKTTSAEESWKDVQKKMITDLSLKYTILSPHTAFIGVEKRVDGNNANMVLKEVPIEISSDDQHLFNAPSSMCYSMSCASAAPRMMKRSMMRMHAPTACAYSTISNTLPQEMSMHSAAAYDAFCDVEESVEESKSVAIEEPAWPTNDDEIVRYLIAKQKFNGAWDLNEKEIEQLTGKPISSFSSPESNDTSVLVTAIVLLVLEKRFPTFSSLWHAVVQKGRKRLNQVLKDKADILLEAIRKQL